MVCFWVLTLSVYLCGKSNQCTICIVCLFNLPHYYYLFGHHHLKRKTSKIQWIAVFLSAIGCALCFISNSNNLFFSFVVAFTYAFYLISQRSNIYFDKLNTLAFQIVIIFILSLPYYFANGFSVPANTSFYMYILAITILFTLAPLYINLYSLKGAPASNVGVMLYVNSLIAFFLYIFYYNAHVNILHFVSYFLILQAVIIFNYRVLTNLTKKFLK